jgi:hypothetical protein
MKTESRTTTSEVESRSRPSAFAGWYRAGGCPGDEMGCDEMR